MKKIIQFLSGVTDEVFHAFWKILGKRKKAQINNGFPVELVGKNWGTESELPIAILFGFNPWKRQVTSEFLPEYKTAFVMGRASFKRVKADFIRKLPAKQKLVFIGWGKKLPWRSRLYTIICRWVGGRSIPILVMEDGFLRSMGSGLLHTRPASICIDSKAMYFNAKVPSDLENLLMTYRFKNDAELMSRASDGLQLMRAARLTKYYDINPYFSAMKVGRTGRYSILVIGQVEDDASISLGKARISRNISLVLEARKDFPEADIYFRPHPDYWSGIRKSRRYKSRLENICAIVPPEVSIYEMFSVVNHVYTITSLAGFEALVHGLKVTTFGAPFYSNWGLTEDRVILRRRKRKLSLEELFAAAYLIYPRYMYHNSAESSSFEKTATYLIVETLKHKNIFQLGLKDPLYVACLPLAHRLATPFQVLAYLQGTGVHAEAKTAEVMAIVEKDALIADYPQISFLLISTANYDALVTYTNFCLAHFGNNIDKYIQNTTLSESFLYSVSLSLTKTNGRVLNLLPNINSWLLALPSSDKNFNALVKNYVKCLSFNLQYDVISDLIKSIEKLHRTKQPRPLEVHWGLEEIIANVREFNFYPSQYKGLAQVLLLKPSRSERAHAKRHQLILSAANEYLESLDRNHTSPADVLFNRVQYWMLLEDGVQTEREFNKFISVFDLSERSKDKARNRSAWRSSEMQALAQYFIRIRRLGAAWKIIEAYGGNSESTKFAILRLMYLKVGRKTTEFFEYYDQMSATLKNDEKVLGVYARLLREMGFFDKARMIYLDLSLRARTVAKRASLNIEVKKLAFCHRSSEILNSEPQPTLPKGVVFLASQTCLNTLAMMVPSLVEVKKKGYAVVNLIEGMTEDEPTGLQFIDRFAGVIPLDMSLISLSNEWEIDWPRKIVKSNGINFYQGFYERLSTFSRRFYVDINMPIINREFRSTLRRADTCLKICRDIFDDVIGKGIPVTFLSGNSHVTPFSVFRDFARSKNHALLGFVNCNVAYESYFSNLGSKFANTMCVTDMTLYPNIRAPFMARKENFERWYSENLSNPEFIAKATAQINVNRVGSSDDKRELEILELIKSKKREGKKIICAFGKVPVDLNVPFDGGPAHSDMADWITNTVEICGASEDIFLLVKPHPHELRPEIALDLVDRFHDLISVQVPENVCLLGHKDINGHALAPYLDLAILYNGSSSLELAAQGIPVLMASHFGRHDYPVDLLYPTSREQYRNFILSINYPIPDIETRKKSAFLLCYLGTDEISILNQYSRRQLTNDNVGVPKWHEDRVQKFLDYGDPKMELIASRIVEKSEIARASLVV